MQTVLTTYKLMLLFFLNNSREPLSNSFLSDYLLEQENNDFFRLQQAISELTEDGLIHKNAVGNRSYYSITENGRETLSYLEQDLPDSVKKNILAHLQKQQFIIKHEVKTPADIYPSGKGNSCTVRCRIVEDEAVRLELSFDVPSREAADSICENWPMKCRQVYDKILEALL